MAESVRSLPTEILKQIEVREWDMRTREGIRRFNELGARSLPSIAINGELVFEAIIPGQEDLVREILRRSPGRDGAAGQGG